MVLSLTLLTRCCWLGRCRCYGDRGLSALPVTYVGKAATFGFMAGFPTILLGNAIHCGAMRCWLMVGHS